jgi:hypothetical protein
MWCKKTKKIITHIKFDIFFFLTLLTTCFIYFFRVRKEVLLFLIILIYNFEIYFFFDVFITFLRVTNEGRERESVCR